MADMLRVFPLCSFVILLLAERSVCQEAPTEDVFNSSEDFVDCGHVFYEDKGTFDSPGFPEVYPNNLDCTWTINMRNGDKIHVYSEYFLVEYQNQCLWDYVEISENSDDAPTPWRYCGNKQFNYTSKSNSISITFHTDLHVQDVGFRIKYDVIRTGKRVFDYCNTTIRRNVFLTSPNYPLPYPPNTFCYYRIQAPRGHRIKLTFNDFHLEKEPCGFDYMTIYDLLPTEHRLVATICGKNNRGTYISTEETMILKLNTDSSIQTKGFNISVIIFSKSTLMTILTSSSTRGTEENTRPVAPTTSTLPNTTTAPYSTNESNTTIIPNTTNITLTPTSRAAIASSIKVPSTRTTTTAQTQSPSTTTFPTEPAPRSPYNEDCSIISTNLTGSLSSPSYPNDYDNNKLCRTLLRANELSSFVIQFTVFDIESAGNCQYDHLKLVPEPIGDQIGEDDSAEIRLCGDKLEKNTFTFETTSLSLIFKSDTSVSKKGYKANYHITPKSNDNPCPIDCKNGATCMRKFSEDNNPSWSCICPVDHHGIFCEEMRITCLTHQCHHDGRCIRDGDEARCECEPGFSGQFCEIQIANGVRFIKKPQNTTVARGGRVLLQCAVSNNSVQVMWIHRDLILNTDDKSHGLEIHPGGVLYIPDMKKRHEGRYTCAVMLSSVWIETSAWLSLVGECNLDVEKAPQNSTRSEGDVALFECIVPDAKSIVWFKDDEPIVEDERKKVLVNNYLMIKNLVETDAGLYTCESSGENGCFVRRSATLFIKGTGHNQYCGRPITDASTDGTYRISSGREALEGTAPWHAIIIENERNTPYCGGSLVNEQWVLTAAHCVSHFDDFFDREFDVAVIDMYFGTRTCNGSGGIKRRLKSYILYPTFNERGFDNDLALFELDKPVTFSDMVMPICLEKKSFSKELLKKGKLGIVTGCGSTFEMGGPSPHLRQIVIPYVPRNLCDASARKSKAPFTEGMICAGYSTSMRGDACAGDSGGSYTMKYNGRWVLMGLVSWGVGCDRQDHYGYYTYISHYYDWILSVSTSKQRIN